MREQWTVEYFKKLAREAFLKAIFCGCICGFAVMFLSSFVFWLIDFSYPWVAFIIAAAVIAGTTLLFYYKKFKPTSYDIARRVDELGLEERLLTMHQLQGDNSYMAMRQREDAKAALKTVSSSLVKIVVSVPLIIAMAAVSLMGAAMATVSVLASQGIVPPGNTVIPNPFDPDPVEYTVEFVENGGGMVVGEIFQIIEEGKPIEEVVAEADEGWYFVGYSWEIDGELFVFDESPVFIVEGLVVQGPMEIIVSFAEVELGEGEGEGDAEGAEGEEGEEGEEQPSESEDGEQKESEENNNENQDGQENENEGEPGEEKPSGSDRYDEKNQIIDNKTNYGDEYGEAKEEAVNGMEQSDELPGDVKDIIKDYFDSIKK